MKTTMITVLLSGFALVHAALAGTVNIAAAIDVAQLQLQQRSDQYQTKTKSKCTHSMPNSKMQPMRATWQMSGSTPDNAALYIDYGLTWFQSWSFNDHVWQSSTQISFAAASFGKTEIELFNNWHNPFTSYTFGLGHKFSYADLLAVNQQEKSATNTAVAPTPIPASAGLFGISALLLLMIRRR